jgi:hypothetical protein
MLDHCSRNGLVQTPTFLMDAILHPMQGTSVHRLRRIQGSYIGTIYRHTEIVSNALNVEHIVTENSFTEIRHKTIHYNFDFV